MTDWLTNWQTGWLTGWLSGWLTDWLSDWLIDWLTIWRTDWLSDWLTHWLIEWLTDWLTDRLTDWLTDWLIDWLTDWLTIWLTDWLTDWLTIWLTDWLTDWLLDPTNWLTDWLRLLCETSFKKEALKVKNEAFLRDVLQNGSFDAQKRSFSARLPSKMKLWSSKTKLLCETSFKNEALKLENEAFLRDFLQKWSVEALKRSISARLPSKMKLWSSKTKHFCETSFKNQALKLKNEAFVRDFLEKWHVDRKLDLRITIRFNDF